MNNNQAIGYTAIAIYKALDNLDFKTKKKYIEKIISEMYHQFDMKTEQEAQQIGRIIELAENKKELQEKLNNFYDKQPVKTVKAKRIK